MFIKIIKKILRKLVEIVINDWVIYKIVSLYKRLFEDKVRKAVGKASLNTITNQGNNCKFHGDVKVYYADGLTLHDNIRVGFGSFFFALGGITIGNNTQISRNVVIYSANHDTESEAIPYDNRYICKPVVIGKSVWIGMNVLILPGVEIGDGAIIGMGTIVTKNVKPGEIVVGSSQRSIRSRDLEKFKELESKGKLFAELWPEN